MFRGNRVYDCEEVRIVKDKKILIVGMGNVGKNIYYEIGALKPDCYDPYKGYSGKKEEEYDIAFICVDTPMLPDGSADMYQVEKALAETDAKICVIKSTVPPKSTERLKKATGRRIVFCPEYYGATQHCNNFKFPFTILGGDRDDCNEVVQVLQNVYDARHKFILTDSTTAELAKYMENSFLATKVSFCVQFWELANQLGVDYTELRELFLCDPRVNRSHTFVYEDHPYWKSHCLDKDLVAITSDLYAPFLRNVINYNEECKKKYKKE